jgi:SPP1 family predicted phage head-tail adaptor
MRWTDVVNLVTVVNGENEIGDPINVETPREVYANKKSIRQSEFYQAAATGLKPEIMFEIRSIEYADEKILEFENKSYTIIRTFSKNGEILELSCARLVNRVS